ncbi:hypothetical protein P280DRAFT_258704 [Massarina eburnea CBS 473.64]|uniref:Uncharacterized protein n=1 Tax=Massarina eburnea CBS 473.64 TaxID=1395130 RepID=A0A6A6RH36_9PLEO|nr:hypothetical protein P280DRAFT_258704 [Massarina eburnea CBS 473.64]
MVFGRRMKALSEKNLRIHTSGLSNTNANTAQDEKARTTQQDTVDIDSLSDTDFSPQDADLAARREASLDALKLYTGSFVSLCTPMERFMASSTTEDVKPFLAKHAPHDSGVAFGDAAPGAVARGNHWETLDATKTASDLHGTTTNAETRDICPGSPRPSSDTLSLSRYQTMYLESKTDRKENGGTRSRRKLRMRRRNTVDRMKASKSPQPSGL